MECLNPPLAFNPAGPIHPLVLAYLAQLHGFIELSSRGLFLTAARLSDIDREKLLSELAGKSAESAKRVLQGGLTGLIDDPSPASLLAPPVKVDVTRLAQMIFSDSEPAIRHFNLQSAGSLLVLAWEHTEQFHTFDPIWEFLRHLRNAVAHGGRFHFLGKEPTRPAMWRGRSIDRALEDTQVFAAPISSGFIGTGDVLHLLADIDAKFVH